MLSSSAWALREKYLCQRRKIQQKKERKKTVSLSVVPPCSALHQSPLSHSFALCAYILCNCKNHLKRHHTISKLRERAAAAADKWTKERERDRQFDRESAVWWESVRVKQCKERRRRLCFFSCYSLPFLICLLGAALGPARCGRRTEGGRLCGLNAVGAWRIIIVHTVANKMKFNVHTHTHTMHIHNEAVCVCVCTYL